MKRGGKSLPRITTQRLPAGTARPGPINLSKKEKKRIYKPNCLLKRMPEILTMRKIQ